MILEELKINLGEISKSLDIEILETAASTNTLLKQKANSGAKEGTIIIAKEQTRGRGRFDRKFFSEKNCGIYMSILLKPTLKAEESVLITTAAAVAVAEAVEHLSGRKTDIKWVNDVLINNKKICGILTEASLNTENNMLNYAVLGIGLNTFKPKNGFAPEIADIADSVFTDYNSSLETLLTAEIILRFLNFYNNISSKAFLEEYRKRSIVKEKEISFIKNNQTHYATVLGIDDNCRLHIRYPNGGEDYLFSGEISIRIS